MATRPRILVTGARLPAALEIARALAREGAEVWAADTLCCTPAGCSRRVHKYLRVPSPVFQPLAFRAAIRQIVAKYRIDLIVPVSEEIFYLAQMREAQELTCPLFSPALATLRRLHSKWSVLEMARDCGVRLPHTLQVTSQDGLRQLLPTLPDYVLKAEYSRGAYQTHFPPHDAIEALPMKLHQTWVLQQRLQGTEISSYAVAVEGRVLAAAVYEPRYRRGRGAGLYFQPVDGKAAKKFVATFVAKNQITGQISFDLMRCLDGQLALIECNPRATSGVHLLSPASRWARAFFDAAPPEAVPASSEESVVPRAAKVAVAALNIVPALLGGRLRALWSDLRASRDSCFQRSDPLPLVGLHLGALEIFLRSFAWQVSADEAYTFDLEWNGDES